VDVDLERPPPRGARILTPAIVASLVLLVASAAAAITFVAGTGGLQLPVASPSDVAAASPSPAGSGVPTAVPTPIPTPTAEATPIATPGSTPATPATTPAPTPEPTPTPVPTSNRYALLEPCPTAPDCYLYTIRIGDNLRSIANFFGVPYATVLELNPDMTDPEAIQPGDVITLPPPTR
jgi:hypothetical protein